MLKDRDQLIIDIAMAKMASIDREDLERIYVEYMVDIYEGCSAAELVNLAESYGVDYQLVEDE